MITRGAGVRRPRLGEWAALAMIGAAAVLLWLLLDSPWPWLLALGVLVVCALIGVRRPAGLAIGLAVADVWWLTMVPWWSWLLAAAAVASVLALWWGGQRWRARRAHQLVPRGVETTAPIPRVRPGWIGFPGVHGRPIQRAHIASAAVAGLLLAAGGTAGGVAAHHADARQAQAELDAAHVEGISRILPRSPHNLVEYFVTAVAERDPSIWCFALVPQAARDFAVAHGGGTDCAAAVDQLSRQIPPGGGIRYQNAAARPLSTEMVRYAGQRVTVDACHIDLDPPGTGPDSIGILTMEDAPGGGGGRHVISYTRCL